MKNKITIMGKRATLYLLYNLLIIFTALLLLAAVGCLYASHIDPNLDSRWIILGLATPAVVLANVIMLAVWIVKRKWVVFIPLAALIVNMGYVSSVFQLPSLTKYEPGQYDIKVATYNVHGFRGDVGFRSAVYEIGDMLKEEDVDVACIQEFRESKTITADSMAASAFSAMPNVCHDNGIAVFSRFPIKAHQFIPFGNNDTNGTMIVDIEVGGRPVRIFAVHLYTTGIASLKNEFDATESDNVRERALMKMHDAIIENSRLRATQVLQIRKLIDASTMPIIVAGDFNDMPSSFTYREIKGDMKDGFHEAGSGYAGTFRNFKGLLRLDYILYTQDITCLKYYIPGILLSDHRPVLAELKLNGRVAQE